VEVKTRAGGSHGLPIEAIDAAKLARMRRCAAEWRLASGWHGRARCLVVTISLEVIEEL
jgi:Holliday junction resolvase-like predicted endonuclease